MLFRSNVTKTKTVKKASKEEILPDWFDKDLETEEASKEEKEQLNEILDSLV